jgi:hypothetical protein
MATRRPLSSGIEAIALLIVSVTITAAIAAAMLVDTLIAPGLSASVALDCRATIHPVVHTMEFADARCCPPRRCR